METVLGAFETRRMAERAIDDLLAAGFSPDQLSALGRHGEAMELTPEHETVEKDLQKGEGDEHLPGVGHQLVDAHARE